MVTGLFVKAPVLAFIMFQASEAKKDVKLALGLQLDELSKMCDVMGSFTPESWPEGQQLLGQLGFKLQETAQPQPWRQVIPNASPEALELVSALCSWDPAKRPTAAQALQHPFFKACPTSTCRGRSDEL